MKLLGQGFQKLEPKQDRLTDTTKHVTTQHLRVVITYTNDTCKQPHTCTLNVDLFSSDSHRQSICFTDDIQIQPDGTWRAAVDGYASSGCDLELWPL